MSGSETFRCGQVALLGRPNAGKSTLLNALVGAKVAIVSAVPQTTRNVILGVRHEPDAQIIFVDTPGIHVPKHEMNRRMVAAALDALQSVDVVVHVIDASDRVGKGDWYVAERIARSGVPVVVALNKVDCVKPKERLLPLMARLAEEGMSAVVPLSATTGRNLDALLGELRERLPVGPPVYPEDLTTDQAERFLLAELIREKVLQATRQEVPHSTTVTIDALGDEQIPARAGDPPRRRIVVDASLVVEKENQKGILIGRGGTMLGRIGTAARRDIEDQLDVSCRMNLFVKVVKKWREDRAMLADVFSGNRGVMPGRPSAEELLAEIGAQQTADGDE